MDFITKLKAIWDKNDSLLCVGLDPTWDMLPAHLREDPAAYFTFSKAIVDATADLVCAYKPNSAFYESRGSQGIEELKQTCDYIKQHYPHIPVILDFKRGDTGTTNHQYANFAFQYLKADAVTVQPYLGQEAVQSYLDYKDKGIIVLCRTSNPGAGEFQDLIVDGRKLYLKVAQQVATEWNGNKNCLLVVGATQPKEMAEIRQLVGNEMIFLVPGFGAQGGDIKETMKAGMTSDASGLIINSSRAIIYASDGEGFADAARQKAVEARDTINQYRQHEGA